MIFGLTCQGSILSSSFFPGEERRNRLVRRSFVSSSLRRHYPDQVQRVDGKRSHPLSRVYPSSPSIEEGKNRVFKRWLLGFLEEIAWPVRPAGFLRFRTEINLQLHANFQGFQSRCPDNAGQLDALFHLHNSNGIWSHMFELWRRDMYDCVCYELAIGSELNPLDSRGSTFWTDRSWWNHDVFAANTPDRH